MTTKNICVVCKKELNEKEHSHWIHWNCTDIFQKFVIKRYGESNAKRCWSMFERKKYIKEYLLSDKEVVQFI